MQQFVVDAWTMVEAYRLLFIRHNQKSLRVDLYKGLTEAVLRGETDPASHGKRIILPSSFVGGARFVIIAIFTSLWCIYSCIISNVIFFSYRYMIQNYQDAMAICRWAGYPDLFITFTCNPKWPEIQRFINNLGLNADDRPDIICRVFKMKLDQLIRDVKEGKRFRRVIASEFTHTHI